MESPHRTGDPAVGRGYLASALLESMPLGWPRPVKTSHPENPKFPPVAHGFGLNSLECSTCEDVSKISRQWSCVWARYALQCPSGRLIHRPRVAIGEAEASGAAVSECLQALSHQKLLEGSRERGAQPLRLPAAQRRNFPSPAHRLLEGQPQRTRLSQPAASRTKVAPKARLASVPLAARIRQGS